MESNKGFGVDFNSSHKEHVFALGCEECTSENFPGDLCKVFEFTPGAQAVKCNHLLTVLDAQGRLDHVFTRPKHHDAWHAALEGASNLGPAEFDTFICKYFGLI